MKEQTIIVANWKSNMTKSKIADFFKKFNDGLNISSMNNVIICAPFPYFSLVSEKIKDTKISLGAQNFYSSVGGAYTGEINADMLIDCDVKYCLIGHSERRNIFDETDKLVNQKIVDAIEKGITPIVCIGETALDREIKITKGVLEDQIFYATENLSLTQVKKFIWAYEPLWAIGTGKVPTKEEIFDAINIIKSTLRELYKKSKYDDFKILYGGSVNKDNCAEICKIDGVDGLLIGGASLKGEEFQSICNRRYKVLKALNEGYIDYSKITKENKKEEDINE